MRRSITLPSSSYITFDTITLWCAQPSTTYWIISPGCAEKILPSPIVTVDDFDDHSVIIKNVNGIYTVEADWLLQVMKGINFDDYESLNYFQKVLINGGVIDALRKKGCSDGDTVSIYELEFDFMD